MWNHQKQKAIYFSIRVINCKFTYSSQPLLTLGSENAFLEEYWRTYLVKLMNSGETASDPSKVILGETALLIHWQWRPLLINRTTSKLFYNWVLCVMTKYLRQSSKKQERNQEKEMRKKHRKQKCCREQNYKIKHSYWYF